MAQRQTSIVKLMDHTISTYRTNRGINIRTDTCRVTGYEMVEAMTNRKARIGELMDDAVRANCADRIIDRRTNATCVAEGIIAVSCTLCVTPVLKLQNLPGGSEHTDRFVDIRTPERTGTAQPTGKVISISMTFSEAWIVKLQGVAVIRNDTNRIIVFGADTPCCIAGDVIAITCALRIAPVVKDQYTAISRENTNRIIDVRANDRAGACRVTWKIVRESMALCQTGILKLQQFALICYNANR